MICLTALNQAEAPQVAQALIQRTQSAADLNQQAIIDILTTIMVYKFTTLSRDEVREMLGFTTTELKNTRFYQEVKAEGELLVALKLLRRQFGELPPDLEQQVSVLSLNDLEAFIEASFDFNQLQDIYTWLERY